MESVKDWVDALYLQYSPKMVAVAMRAGFTIEEAEDLTQETLYEFHQKNMADYDSLLAPYRLRHRFVNSSS